MPSQFARHFNAELKLPSTKFVNFALARLVASGQGARGLDGFGKVATHRAEHERWDLPLGQKRETSGLARKFSTAIQLKSSLAKKFRGKAHVFGAVNAPKPKLFFLALQEVQGLLELLHGPIKRGAEEKHA